jgi:hypothetical protein
LFNLSALVSQLFTTLTKSFTFTKQWHCLKLPYHTSSWLFNAKSKWVFHYICVSCQSWQISNLLLVIGTQKCDFNSYVIHKDNLFKLFNGNSLVFTKFTFDF